VRPGISKNSAEVYGWNDACMPAGRPKAFTRELDRKLMPNLYPKQPSQRQIFQGFSLWDLTKDQGYDAILVVFGSTSQNKSHIILTTKQMKFSMSLAPITCGNYMITSNR